MSLRVHVPFHHLSGLSEPRSLAPRMAIVVAILLFLLSLARPAHGGVPSPVNSTLPDCLVFCPLGDMPVTVVVRDIANNPVASSSVVFDFSECPAAFVCPTGPSDPYLYTPANRTIRAFTNAIGSVVFPARVGGVGGIVRVYADGVMLHSYTLASPDQDGNGMVVGVIGLDDPIFIPKLGSADPTADFDCSGVVNFDDEQIFYFHHSHACGGYVDPARRSSWGAVKLHYR